MTRDSRKPLGLDDVFIVDCDVHANEPPEALAPYIDMPWRRSLELLGRGPAALPGHSRLRADSQPGSAVPRTAESATEQ